VGLVVKLGKRESGDPLQRVGVPAQFLRDAAVGGGMFVRIVTVVRGQNHDPGWAGGRGGRVGQVEVQVEGREGPAASAASGRSSGGCGSGGWLGLRDAVRLLLWYLLLLWLLRWHRHLLLRHLLLLLLLRRRRIRCGLRLLGERRRRLRHAIAQRILLPMFRGQPTDQL